jgi:hypothetical protein
MKIRHTFIVAISISLLLSGCVTPSDEAQIARLMRHRDWPRIQKIAETEVKKREILGTDIAAYLPEEHKDKVWCVAVAKGNANGDVITLLIGDDGSVLMYKRSWEGAR